MSNLLQECYTTNCDTQIILSHDKLNKIQLSNVTVTLDAIVEAKNIVTAFIIIGGKQQIT